MSGPSSEGRPSVSSEPSAASSPTLNSRGSGAYENNGEGSSRHDSPAGNGLPEPESRRNESPRSAEAIEEQDFARRRHRSRRSAAFLLDDAFFGGPRTRHSYNGAHAEDGKSNRSSYHKHHDGNGASNSSPLSREVGTGESFTDQGSRVDSANPPGQSSGGLRVPKTRNSVRGIPAPAQDTEIEASAPRPTIDPNQIVHMALNLSESRRRNLSVGQLLVPPPRPSSGLPQDGSFRNYTAGSSLRQYLNEQRRTSRNMSPIGGRSSPSRMRHMSTSMQRSGSMYVDGRRFEPTDATLARRDKARAFFELRIEYLRLLEFLPPLKPDSSEPGNFIVTANNVPGSPHADLSRMPSHAGKQYDLGRPYNPLQLLRNRRTRARERKAFDHPPEEFQDVEQVRDWVNRVERGARQPGYRQQDQVSLPVLHEDHQTQNAPPKPSRPHMVWAFTAEELLADAHWVEHGDNKTVIEDRHGRKIFPPKEPQKQELLQPRGSKEYPDKRRRSWVEGLPRLSLEVTPGEESEPNSERGRKRRLLPTFRAESPKPKKHVRTGSRPLSRSYTDSSDSDSGSQKGASRKPRKVIDVNNNTGPLALRMKELMEEEARNQQGFSKSPAALTPDTPDKWGRDHADADADAVAVTRNSLEVPQSANGSTQNHAGFALKIPPNSRTDTNLSIDPSKEPRTSLDDLDSTAPNTPIRARILPHIGSDLSPPPSRGASESRKPKKSRLDIFRTDENVKGHKREQSVGPDSAGLEKKRSSRQVSEELDEGNGLGSAIWAAPGAVKNLLIHRKNASMSSLHSPEKESRKEGKDLKEPPSAVTRFFKGVKNEGSKAGSKVGGFVFRRDRPPEDSDSESLSDGRTGSESESDADTGKPERKFRPHLGRTTTAETAASSASKMNSRYHLDLPSFRSSHLAPNDEDPAYATDSILEENHISRQARERANSRSPRFERLAPPRMDLRGISASSPSSPTRSQERISKVLARPGGVGQAGLPHTALADVESSTRRGASSRPTLEGKRHWSITDEDGHVLHRKTTPNIVSQADIARVRALFLCSGVKAKEIARRAHAVRAEPAPFLVRAAKAGNARLIPVSKKEEHVLAARILVRTLESSTQALHASADEFRETTVKELTSMAANLKSIVESELLPRVRSSSDEAVKITSQVSGDAPLAVKQVSDEISRMIRMRRRRMRWVRRVGWMLVEWMLLGFMWCAWLVVVLLSSVKKVVGFVWTLIRWLLWI